MPMSRIAMRTPPAQGSEEGQRRCCEGVPAEAVTGDSALYYVCVCVCDRSEPVRVVPQALLAHDADPDIQNKVCHWYGMHEMALCMPLVWLSEYALSMRRNE